MIKLATKFQRRDFVTKVMTLQNEHGLKQHEVAELLGIGPTQLSHWCRDTRISGKSYHELIPKLNDLLGAPKPQLKPQPKPNGHVAGGPAGFAKLTPAQQNKVHRLIAGMLAMNQLQAELAKVLNEAV